MKCLSDIFQKYAAFESAVTACGTKIYLNDCSACKGQCCKMEYCEESLTSAFLSRLRQHFAPDLIYDSQRAG